MERQPCGRPWAFPMVLLWAGLAALLTLSPHPVPAEPTNDRYIAGYATAVLEHEFQVTNALVEVSAGVIRVTSPSWGKVDKDKVSTALGGISGVRRVEFIEAEVPPTAIQPQGRGPAQSTTGPPESKWLPRGLLFAPLHADPRWAHFAGVARVFTSGLSPTSTFAGNFGETFAVYRDRAPLGGEWELGIQAGVFSLLDFGKRSIDLTNADYLVGFIGSYRKGPFAGFVRYHHQSSHLGDEFLLNNHVERINLSFEEVDAKISLDVTPWWRLYGGGGMVVRREPRIGRGTSQWGTELRSPVTYLRGLVRPVAYADFQAHERTNWSIGRSLMAGVQFENARVGDRQIQLLAEYYAGPSPDGQFYTQKVEWAGIGVHFYF